MPITALYAALLTPLFIALSFRVIGKRRQDRISLGDGGDPEMLRRVRAHGNFAEYTPMALILIGLSESLLAAPLLLHAMGIALLLGRLAHALSISVPQAPLLLRVAGMVTTFAVLAVGALTCLGLAAMARA